MCEDSEMRVGWVCLSDIEWVVWSEQREGWGQRGDEGQRSQGI